MRRPKNLTCRGSGRAGRAVTCQVVHVADQLVEAPEIKLQGSAIFPLLLTQSGESSVREKRFNRKA